MSPASVAAAVPAAPPSDTPLERRLRLGAVALAALFSLALLGGERYVVGRLGFPLDDSFIHLQFARNLATGQGLVYNPGEPVAGSTAPLWSALVGLLFLLPGSTILWVKLAGIAFHALSVDASFRLARKLGLDLLLSTGAALATAATSWLLWASLSGMEIPFFCFLTLAGMRLAIEERDSPLEVAPRSLIVFAAATLARPEGMYLLVLAFVDRLIRLRRDGEALSLARPDWKGLGIGVAASLLVIAPVLAYHYAIGGTVLPTAYAVKASSTIRFSAEPHFLQLVLAILVDTQGFLPMLAVAGAVVLLARLGGDRDAGITLAGWGIGLPFAYSMIAAPNSGAVGNFGRYFFPLLPATAVLAMVALSVVTPDARRVLRLGATRIPLAAVLALVVAWPLVSTSLSTSEFYLENVANVEDSDVAVAEWLRPRLDPRALLAVNDIGALKYLLPNPIVDTAGIANPDLFRYVMKTVYGSGGIISKDHAVYQFLSDRKPDFVAVFPNWWGYPEHHPEAFKELYRKHLPNNVTMGGDDVVVYSTPWTRYPLHEPAAP